MITVNINLKTPIHGSIIDFETTDLSPLNGELVCAGFLSETGLSIVQRTEEKAHIFAEYINDKLAVLPKPLYAFNREFEERFCNVPVSCNLQFKEESTLYALKTEGLLDLYNSLGDPIRGGEVPLFWKAYNMLNEPAFLSKIIRHNYCCLAKEYYLKLVRYDGIELEIVKPLLNSALIEIKWINPKIEKALFSFPEIT